MAAAPYTSVAVPSGLPDRTARASYALGAVAFSYFDALARSDWVAATGLLTYFQELYNKNRQAVLLGFAPDVQLEAARRTPSALPLNGQFGAATRTALVAALASGFIPYTSSGKPAGPSSVSPSVADSMPNEAGALASWFIATIVPRVPRTGGNNAATFAWSVANIAATASMAQAVTDVRGVIDPFIMGGASAVPDVVATGGSSTDAARQAVHEAQRDPLSASSQPAGFVQYFTGMPIGAAPPKKMPDWGYYAAGAGILGLGGLLAYLNWKRRS